jgi:hypothetical protein
VIDSGSLLLFGHYDAKSIERIGGSGTLELASSLANAGGTLDGSGLAQLTIHGIGTIVGGTVVGLSRPGAATLDGVTWQGPLHEGNTHLTILNGLNITGEDGSTPGAIDINGASVVFAGSQSFDNADITGRGAIYADDTLTLGAGARIAIADFGLLSIGRLQPANGQISNAGLIEVIGQPRFPSDQGVAAMISVVDFENTGTVATAGTGGLASDAFIAFDGSKIVNHASAMLAAFGGRVTVSSGSVLTNDGTIEADAGTIQIGGLLQGSGRVDVTDGGVVEFGGAVAPGQSIDLVGSATLALVQPAFFMGRIGGLAVGDAIKLGVSATPVSYAAGDLQLQTAQSQTSRQWCGGRARGRRSDFRSGFTVIDRCNDCDHRWRGRRRHPFG